MQEIALFSGKIYTVGKNFTQPLVVMVATNLNSENSIFLENLHIYRNKQIIFSGSINAAKREPQWSSPLRYIIEISLSAL